MRDDEGADETGVLGESDNWVDLSVGVAEWQSLDRKYYLMEKDYRVRGEVWRVHKGDADPFPSNPHAHCIGGAKRFVGCTLHLGTGELFRGRQSMNRCLEQSLFDRLIELIRPKFPGLKLPLDS